VKGFSQKKGVDFDEIFSPVVKMSSIRIVLGTEAHVPLQKTRNIFKEKHGAREQYLSWMFD
jgi:hypothetical protein